MPKKILRSNNRLRKTNRKGRKTANRNRLRKFVGGTFTHAVRGTGTVYTIKQMEECYTQIYAMYTAADVTKRSGREQPSYNLVKELLHELCTYLSERIYRCREWEEKDARKNAAAKTAAEGEESAVAKYAREQREAKAKLDELQSTPIAADEEAAGRRRDYLLGEDIYFGY